MRLARFVEGDNQASEFKFKVAGFPLRLLSAFLSLTLFFSASPALLAMSARQAMSGGGGNGGGAGRAANLQNAGAASASLTSQLAQADLQKTDSAVTAMQAMQARAHAIMAPAGTPNGLKVGWLDAYNPTGAMNSKYPTVPVTWGGVSSLNQSGNTVTVTQKSQSAYLYWNHFSVGPQTKVNFDQSAGGNNVGTWIAFNKVMGNVNPSQIYGSITAQGQVYILNQNGILFHNGSQVNTHALVASTLPINENLAGDALDGVTASGIVNFPNSVAQFLFTALDPSSYDPNNKGNVVVSASLGDVVVEQGASISAPVNASHSGGLVALIGPDVYNDGSISTPNGQTILAAGLQVALTPHPSSDPTLRGLDVTVGKVDGSGIQTHSVLTGASTTGFTGIADNGGYLYTPEGDVTIAGKTVQQDGVIDSSTSVSFNGRIDLQANYNAQLNTQYTANGLTGGLFFYLNTGQVEIGGGSVMRILPEWSSTATITGSELALNPVVSIIGQTVEMASGSIIDAPGAITTSGALSQTGFSLASGVNIKAGNWFLNGINSDFIYTSGQIDLSSGSIIDVGGSTDVEVNSSQNFLTLQMRGAELADSPLQQGNNNVRGQNLTIDMRMIGTYTYDGVTYYWVGTPLGDATGYAALIEKTVGQLTEQGGSVSLDAGGSVTTEAGSAINVSGGWTQYSGGDFSTTKLIYQGHLVDISQATPDRVYSGIYTGTETETDAKWGITKTFTSILNPTTPQYQAPYISGADGGSIAIQAPLQLLSGSMIGTTVTGPRQLRETASLSTLPSSSSLTLDLFGESLVNGNINTVSPYAPTITFAVNGTSSESSMILSPDLVSSDSFGNLTVLNHDGTITLPVDTALNAGVNGSVSLEAANVTIDGSITAPGGSISLMADLAPYGVINAVSLFDSTGSQSQPLYDVVVDKQTGEIMAQYGASSGGKTTVINADGTISSVSSALLKHYDAGVVTVGSEATISTAGLLVNDSLSSSSRDLNPVALNGGSIAIAGYQVALKPGGVLNVSGGALLTPGGSTAYGNAGSISIDSGQASFVSGDPVTDIHNGSLQLAATLEGYAGMGASAGTLAISAPAIQIGGSSSDSRILNLTPDFFDQGGFGTFNLTGIGLNVGTSTADFVPGINIAAGTTIQPEVTSEMALPSAGTVSWQSFLQPSSYRPAANLTFNAQGLSDANLQVGDTMLVRGNLVMGEGASITLNPQIALSGSGVTTSTGSLTLKGQTVAVLGSITVPGGSITISGGSSYVSNVQNPVSALITVDLASSARLSTAGEALFIQDPLGMRQQFGAVLPGGSISVNGNILAESGSVLNASGASGVYDLFPYQLGMAESATPEGILPTSVIPYNVESAGGVISLQGAQELYSDAALMAQSGGFTAAGGILSISSGRFYQSTETSEPTDLNLSVGQGGSVIPTSFQKSGSAAIGQALASLGGIAEGGGHIAGDSFAGGGFDAVTLGGNVLFHGPIDLSVQGSLTIATGGVLFADSTVNLSASYVALGTRFVAPLQPNDKNYTTIFGSSATQPIFTAPSFGTGELNVVAKLIDIGNLSLQNIESANLTSLDGAIRGDGTLDIAGKLVLKAAEIYPVSGVDFTMVAYNHDALTGVAESSGGVGGSITVEQSGSMNLPLSAAGTLSLYAASITQGGSLLAPFGNINLGWDGSGLQPGDPLTGADVPKGENQTITSLPQVEKLGLLSGSITSISAVDPATGVALSIPYGTSADGSTWDNIAGYNITTTGLNLSGTGVTLSKSVLLTAQDIITQKGSLIDLQGGGDVTASEWISGLGGTINLLGTASSSWSASANYSAGALVTYQGKTWSARQANDGVTPSIGSSWTQVASSYAIIPGYTANYAPTGYGDGSLGVGSQITLSGGAGLPAGSYTLLPASYATQPGAYLISATSLSESLAGSFTQPDGSVIVSGTRFNGLDTAVTTPQTTSLFQLYSPNTLAARAQYESLSANSFFLGTSSQPANAGKLVFNASASMSLNGNVFGKGGAGGAGASIDISSPLAIDITQNGTGGISGDVILGADQLSSWSFGSLLLGGERGTASDGLTPVTVTASSVTVESGATLTGNDIILAGNDGITLDQGASIIASDSSVAPNENLSVTGDGALLRISSDQNTSLTRSGSDDTAVSGYTIGAGVKLSGASITLDSSGNASISSSALLDGQVINLSAGTIALNFDGTTESGALNLSGNALKSLSTAQALSLLSYNSIDFHGSGLLGSSSLGSLSLHAGEILGDNNGVDSILASSILLDNAKNSTDPSAGTPSATGGSLSLAGRVLTLGTGALSIGGFQNVTATENGGIEGAGKGSLITAGNLTLNTPVLTGAGSAVTTISSGGVLKMTPTGSSALTPGLGASFSLKGSSVDISVPVLLPSGSLAVTALSGDVTIFSLLDVAGTSQSFFNVVKYTSAGAISLASDTGSVDLAAGSSLNLNAPSVAGSAGSLSISTPLGTSTFGGSMSAKAANGAAGSFTMDVASYNSGFLAPLESTLTSDGFTDSQSLRLRSGDITVSDVQAHSYTLSADAGSITVNGTIDASGENAAGTGTGGAIALQASGSVVLDSGSLLTVHADTYDSAGKAGSVFLSAGAEINGNIDSSAVLDLQSGSAIDLGVTAAATSIQDVGGVLHLRTPEAALQNITLASSITGASSIKVEGYKLYQVSGSAGTITTTLRSTIASDIANFYGSAGVNSGAASSILASLDANLTTANQGILNLAPGVEIINQSGGLTLGSDWDLSSLRAGVNKTPGFLTLRSSGSITFNASLSDGFKSSAYNAKLLSQNTALPANFQSWAYQITAGADLGAANPNAVVAGSGANITLGIPYAQGGPNVAPNSGPGGPGQGAMTSEALAGYYQVIRTGTGNISINTSGDLQFWNQFSSIYTVGVQVTDPTLGGTFDTPNPVFYGQSGGLNPYLGYQQETSAANAAQYSYGGGNIAVHVGGNMTQLALDINGNTIADSEEELPSNWLYRRGALDPTTGNFLNVTTPLSEIESTSWWVDFSNFFDNFGALGGGNITLNAAGDISNINASIPTNYRMPGHVAGSTVAIAPNAATGVELGGGNLEVKAGGNIDAGVYYVEKGNGSLNAGGSIISNPTRDPNNPTITGSTPDTPQSYLPTTLFLGKGNFDVQAGGNILLGPVANVFLTPQGVNNSYWYKNYFSTYASTDQVNVTSLGGNITFREEAVTSSDSIPEPMLQLWMEAFTFGSATGFSDVANYQPWLRLAESDISNFGTLLSLAPPTLNAAALSGSITIQGNYTTTPSPTGNITLVASGSINGLTYAGTSGGQATWISSQINLSDADPSLVPGVSTPLSMRTALISFGETLNNSSIQISQIANGNTDATISGNALPDLAQTIDALFAESGSYAGSYATIQTKAALNDSILLHAADALPLQFYAQSGDISGLTLYSAKQSDISAGGSITDVGLYIQNNASSDISVVSAGGDIIPYDPTSPLQQLAQAASSGSLQSGDIQISGPGTLEVLAGDNVDLGNNPGSGDPTINVGITSIGNARNPALPFTGADIIVSAGIKLPTGLSSPDALKLQDFVSTVLDGPDGATYLTELSDAMTYSGDPLSGTITAASFASGSSQLSGEEKAKLELQLFYLVLRDTGRNHNKVSSSGFGSYATGEKAIESLIGSSAGTGSIITWSQDIATVNGGNIDLFAPGGGLTLASISSKTTGVAPGIITEGGGGINIYTQQNVSIGVGRIFTLKGGDIMIWSDQGNIAAGSSAKTVQSAPPTQVLIDPTSGNVETDLAGLATGGGIGVLETVAGVPPGNVDLIAPSGVIDAGDAGIRSSGNLNLAATKILNASNIAASGSTSGAPPAAAPASAPNLGSASAAASAGAANNSAAQTAANNSSAQTTEPAASIISVEVLGYGGGDGSDDDESSDPNKAKPDATPAQQAAL